MRWRSLLVVLAAAPFAVLPAGAAAAPTWLRPEALSLPGQKAETPQVALDAAGDATAVWRRLDGANYIVQSAYRPAGGTWSSPVDLSAAGQDAEAPSFAEDAAGDAVAVWARFNGAETGSNSIVQAAARGAGGPWGSPVDLSLPGRNAELAQVGLDAAGEAVALWRRFDGFDFIVQAATRTAGGTWSAPRDLSATGQNAETPRLALNAAGDAVAVWRRFDGSNFVVQGAALDAGSNWGEALILSATGENAVAPQVAIDGAGIATAVWSRSNGSNYVIESADRPPGGAWSTPAELSAPGQNAEAPQVALDAAGRGVVAWSRGNGGGSTVVQGTSRDPNGAWSAPLDLSQTGGAAVAPRVAINGAGDALALWSFSNATPTVVEGSLRSAGGSWQPQLTVSRLGVDSVEPALALDPSGNALAAWVLEEGGQHLIQAAALDGAPPDLDSLSIPPAATIDRPVAFSVDPFDVWSPIESTAWSFGDGAIASGPASTHVFDSLGSRIVTVTATDAFGNAATAGGAIRVYPGARASRNALLRGRRARLRLHCPSPAGCGGRIRLIAVARIERRGHLVGHRVQIGGGPFAISGGPEVTVGVPLSTRGATLVREAMPDGLKAQLTGPGVKHRLVIVRVPR